MENDVVLFSFPLIALIVSEWTRISCGWKIPHLHTIFYL